MKNQRGGQTAKASFISYKSIWEAFKLAFDIAFGIASDGVVVNNSGA